MEKQPATLKFNFPDLKPTLADVKEKVLGVLNSREFAQKFDSEFPANATARGLPVKSVALTLTGGGTDTAGKGGGSGQVGVTITWGK